MMSEMRFMSECARLISRKVTAVSGKADCLELHDMLEG